VFHLSGFVVNHPVPDAGYKKIYRQHFYGQKNAVVPEPVQQAQRYQQTDFDRQKQPKRVKRIIIPLFYDHFSQKKHADIDYDKYIG